MSTRIILCTSSKQEGLGDRVDVVEDFDTVFEHIYPTQNPASNLEARSNFVYNKADGSGRVLIHPSNVSVVEENPQDE